MLRANWVWYRNGEVVMVHRSRQVLACAILSAAICVAGCSEQSPIACGDAAVVKPTISTPIECPGLFTVLVVPAKVDVGGSAALTATAPPGMDGGATALSWSAPSGVFSDPRATRTTFQCTAAGNVTLTLTVMQAGCGETLRAQVECLGPGDGGTNASD